MTHPRPPRQEVRAAALTYEQGSDALPRVVASGRGAVAERIVDLAFLHGVPVREDADLARVLAAIDPGTEIPPDAIMAVAEVLSHLYRLNRSLASDRSGPALTEPKTDPA
ncbi:EscU/YscU/HrcU family type III secretion system export apparatus switch protein [Rhodocista pekingensis]|uniref:EscU/YscU/HrcU family type III secretion system export apparatus switch protein n=1 Tax=Rhodocista pekingensis TaxID=201185 RepID=A0ABW2L114_9PROT